MSTEANIVRRSLAVSLSGRYAVTALQFISVIVLSRLLTPEEIGVYTVGIVLVNIAHMIRDLGISNYILQEKALTKDKVAAAFALAIFIAWSLGSVLMLVAPFLAVYVGEPGVTHVTRIVALNFFVIPLGCFAPALLKRNMCFGAIFKIDIAQVTVSVAAAITLAYADYGYLSMAWASVLGTMVRAVLCQAYLPTVYRTLPSTRGVMKIFHFGKYVVSSNLLKELDAFLLNTLSAKYLGLATVGYLSRAQGYEKLFNNTIAKGAEPVIYASLAKGYRNDSDLRSAFLSTFEFTTGVSWFSLGFLALMSSDFILLLYGDQWAPAIPLASIICLIGCFTVVSTLMQRTLQATGEVRAEFIAKLIATAFRMLTLVLAIKLGIEGLLLALLLVYLIESVFLSILIARQLGCDLRSISKSALTSASVAGTSLLVPMFFFQAPEILPYSNFTELMVAGFFSLISWVVATALFRHPIANELRSILMKIRAIGEKAT